MVKKLVPYSLWLIIIFNVCFPLAKADTALNLNKLPDNAVIAQVGKYKITVADFKAQLRFYEESPSFRDKLMALTPEGRKAILQSMIRDRLLYLDAKRVGTKLDKKTEERLANLRRALIIKEYVKDRLKANPITETEMKQYYEKHKKEFMIPEEIKVRHIVVRTKKEAEKILKQLKNGASFAKLASKYNIDATKDKGGEIGWIRRGVMVKPFEDAAFKLKKGEISGIVKTKFGYHIIKVEDIRKAEQRTFKEVKEIIRRQLVRERIKQIEDELKKKYGVKVYPGVLDKLLGENSIKGE